MLPNRFPDSGTAAEFNSVDASLWYVIAVHEFLEVAQRESFEVSATDHKAFPWDLIGKHARLIVDTRGCVPRDKVAGTLWSLSGPPYRPTPVPEVAAKV